MPKNSLYLMNFNNRAILSHQYYFVIMSEDTIKTKKKDKSVWKSLGMAAMAVVAVAGTIAKEMNKK